MTPSIEQRARETKESILGALIQGRESLIGKIIAEALTAQYAENAALRAERDETQKHKRILVYCAERLALLPDDSPEANIVAVFQETVEKIKDEEISDLSAQLATAIAERDDARTERDEAQQWVDSEPEWKARYMEIHSNLEAELKTTKKQLEDASIKERVAHQDFMAMSDYCKTAEEQRDSALVACAAKDEALWQVERMFDKMDEIVWDGDFRPSQFSQTRIDVANAKSPNAGSDYVPKGPMVELYDALKTCKNRKYSDGTLLYQIFDSKLVDSALTSAAPYLTTDSTGEDAH